jgi:hypothetical protein
VARIATDGLGPAMREHRFTDMLRLAPTELRQDRASLLAFVVFTAPFLSIPTPCHAQSCRFCSTLPKCAISGSGHIIRSLQLARGARWAARRGRAHTLTTHLGLPIQTP